MGGAAACGESACGPVSDSAKRVRKEIDMIGILRQSPIKETRIEKEWLLRFVLNPRKIGMPGIENEVRFHAVHDDVFNAKHRAPGLCYPSIAVALREWKFDPGRRLDR